MADIVKNPVSSAIYLEKKDAALLERLKKIQPVKDLFTGKTVWIYEDMAPTIEEVLNIAVAKQSLLRCAEWVAPTHENEVIRIRHWEKDRMRHRLPRIRIIPPPSVDFLTLHALVQARTVTC